MKKKYMLGLTVLSIMALAAGATTVMAASSTSNSIFSRGKNGMHQGQNLTEAQKTEIKTKIDAVNTALENGDYTTWVAAETALNANSPMLQKVTADNFATYVKEYKDREVKMTEMKTRIDAVNTAITNNDYAAWATAEKAVNTNSPLLEKINSSNFSKFVEAHKLIEQANVIMKDLGINHDRGMGMGGEGFGLGRGHGGMMNNEK